MSELTTSLSRVMNLATRLRSMSEKIKDGEFKRVVDAMLLELAELQLKLEDVVTEHAALKGQLQTVANPKGELCPRCGELGWRLASSRPHKTPGVIAQTYTCPKCRLKEEVLVKA